MSDASVHDWGALASDRPMPGVERRRVIGERVMVSRVELEAGTVVAVHTHENEQIALVVSGRIRFTLPGGRVEELVGGQALLVPGGVEHGAEAVERTVVMDVFAPPSATTGVDRR